MALTVTSFSMRSERQLADPGGIRIAPRDDEDQEEEEEEEEDSRLLRGMVLLLLRRAGEPLVGSSHTASRS
jgi:hypothetical protein